MLSCFLYYRLTILPSEDKVVPMFERISKFHKEFMDKYKDDDDEKRWRHFTVYSHWFANFVLLARKFTREKHFVSKYDLVSFFKRKLLVKSTSFLGLFPWSLEGGKGVFSRRRGTCKRFLK